MTQHPQSTIETCPQCRATNSVPMAAGDRLCLSCRYEWDPRAEPAPADDTAPDDSDPVRVGPFITPVVIVTTHKASGVRSVERNSYITSEPHTTLQALTYAETFAAGGLDGEPADEFTIVAMLADDYDENDYSVGFDVQVDTPDVATVADPVPDNVIVLDEFQRMVFEARAKYVGKRVTIGPDNEPGRIIDITNDGVSVIELDNGELAELLPDEYEIVGDVPVESEPADEVVAAIGSTTLELAALVLQAGAATMAGATDEAPIGVPPIGWLPTDGDVMPIVEQGAAYAVALLIHAYGVPADHIAAMADSLTRDARASAPEQEK